MLKHDFLIINTAKKGKKNEKEISDSENWV